MRAVLLLLLMSGFPGLRGDALDDLRGALKGLRARTGIRVQVQRDGWEDQGGKRTPVHRVFEVQEPVDGPVQAGDHQEVARAHETLLERLSDARLLEAGMETLEGRPVLRLRVALAPDMDANARKRVKRFEHVADLWLGPDGLPFRMQERMEMEMRVLLMFAVRTQLREVRTFIRMGDRLVLATQDTEVQGKAMGKAFAGQEQVRVSGIP